MQSDLLDCAARLQTHSQQCWSDLRRLGFEDWQLRVTVQHHGHHGLHDLWVRATELSVARHEAVVSLMRAPGSSKG